MADSIARIWIPLNYDLISFLQQLLSVSHLNCSISERAWRETHSKNLENVETWTIPILV